MTEEDFSALYTALRDSVFAFATRRVGFEAAHDIVSETFAAAWQGRDEFPADRSKWAAWVVGIAKNKVFQEIDRKTRKHHDNRFAEDWVGPQAATDGEDVARAVVDSDTARRTYEQLSPADRLVFDVAYFRALGPVEAAAVLNITPTAFTTRLSRLRQRIRQLQGDDSAASTTANPGGAP